MAVCLVSPQKKQARMCKQTILNSYLVTTGVVLRIDEPSAFILGRLVHRRWNESHRDAGKMNVGADEDVPGPSSSRFFNSFSCRENESRDTNGKDNMTSMERAGEPSSRSVVVVAIPDAVFEQASPTKFSAEEDYLKFDGGEGPQPAPGSPWWCTRVACAANVLLLVLVFTALLIVFRRVRMSENDVEALEEQLDEQGLSLEETTDKTLQGFIIDLPCRPGYKYFRGRCRRLF